MALPKLIDFDEKEEEDAKPKNLMDFDKKPPPKKTSGWGKVMGKGAIKGVLKSWGVKTEATSDNEDEDEEDKPPWPKKKKRQTTQRQDALSQVQEERSRGLETATGLGRLYGRQETVLSPGG